MLAGRYDNPMPTWLLAIIAGLKLPAQEIYLFRSNYHFRVSELLWTKNKVRSECSWPKMIQGFRFVTWWNVLAFKVVHGYLYIQYTSYTVKNAVELLGAFRPDVEKIQYH